MKMSMTMDFGSCNTCYPKRYLSCGGGTEASLTGELFDGTSIERTDAVNLVPCKDIQTPFFLFLITSKN